MWGICAQWKSERKRLKRKRFEVMSSREKSGRAETEKGDGIRGSTKPSSLFTLKWAKKKKIEAVIKCSLSVTDPVHACVPSWMWAHSYIWQCLLQLRFLCCVCHTEWHRERGGERESGQQARREDLKGNRSGLLGWKTKHNGMDFRTTWTRARNSCLTYKKVCNSPPTTTNNFMYCMLLMR